MEIMRIRRKIIFFFAVIAAHGVFVLGRVPGSIQKHSVLNNHQGSSVLKNDHTGPWSWVGPYGIGNSGATKAVAPMKGPRTAVVGYGDIPLGVIPSVAAPLGTPGFIVSARSGFGMSHSTNKFDYASGPSLHGDASLIGSNDNMGGMASWTMSIRNSLYGSVALLSTGSEDIVSPTVAATRYMTTTVATANITNGDVFTIATVSSLTDGKANGRVCKVVSSGRNRLVVAFGGLQNDETGGIVLVTVGDDGKIGKTPVWVKTWDYLHDDNHIPAVCLAKTTPAIGKLDGGAKAIWLNGFGTVTALSEATGDVIFTRGMAPNGPSVSVSPVTGEAYFVAPDGRTILGALPKGGNTIAEPRLVASLPAEFEGNVTAPIAVDIRDGMDAVVVGSERCVSRLRSSGKKDHDETIYTSKVRSRSRSRSILGGDVFAKSGPAMRATVDAEIDVDVDVENNGIEENNEWTYCIPAAQRKLIGDFPKKPAFVGLAVDGGGSVYAAGCGSLALIALDGSSGKKNWALWDRQNSGSFAGPPAIAPDGTILGATAYAGAYHATPGSWDPRPVKTVTVVIDPREDGNAIAVTAEPEAMTDYFGCNFEVTVHVDGDDSIPPAKLTIDPSDVKAMSSNPVGWMAVFPKYADIYGKVVASVVRVSKVDGAKSDPVTASRMCFNGSPSPSPSPAGGTVDGNNNNNKDHKLVIGLAAAGGGIVLIAIAALFVVKSRRSGRDRDEFPALVSGH